MARIIDDDVKLSEAWFDVNPSQAGKQFNIAADPLPDSKVPTAGEAAGGDSVPLGNGTNWRWSAYYKYQNSGKFGPDGNFRGEKGGGSTTGVICLTSNDIIHPHHVVGFWYGVAKGNITGAGGTAEYLLQYYHGITRAEFVNGILQFVKTSSAIHEEQNRGKAGEDLNLDKAGLSAADDSSTTETRDMALESSYFGRGGSYSDSEGSIKKLLMGGDIVAGAEDDVKAAEKRIDDIWIGGDLKDVDNQVIKAIACIIIGYFGINRSDMSIKADAASGLSRHTQMWTDQKIGGEEASWKAEAAGLSRDKYGKFSDFEGAGADVYILPHSGRIKSFRADSKINKEMIASALHWGSTANANFIHPDTFFKADGNGPAGYAMGSSRSGKHPFAIAEKIIAEVIPGTQRLHANLKSAIEKGNDYMKKGQMDKLLAPITKALSPRGNDATAIEKARQELQENIKQCILLAGMGELQKLSTSLRTGIYKNAPPPKAVKKLTA